jgi:hypothetical protein
MGHRSPPLVITQIEVDRLVDVATPTCMLVAVEWIRLVYANASLRTCTRSNSGRRCCWSSLHRLTTYVCNRTDQGMKFVHGGKGKFRSVVVPFPLEGWT